VEYVGVRSGRSFWLFKCSRCGNTKEIDAHNVVKGLQRSCGCLRQQWYDDIRVRWPAKHLRLLSKVSDATVAELVGASVRTVLTKRKSLGISPYKSFT
jgi:hypothetical protein